MAEIKQKVRNNIAFIMGECIGSPENVSAHITKILDIPELAIVDRSAEYPDMVFYCKDCNKMVKNTLCNIVDSGWVKEVK